ncbi:MAG: hypothetical protein ACLU0O_08375 [Collinsella sp.]
MWGINWDEAAGKLVGDVDLMLRSRLSAPSLVPGGGRRNDGDFAKHVTSAERASKQAFSGCLEGWLYTPCAKNANI